MAKYFIGNVKGPKGDTGNGIESVDQTVISQEDDGINEATITMTDGSKATIQVKNGSKGSQGEQGLQGIQGIPGTVPSVTINGDIDTDVTPVIDIAYEGLVVGNGVRVSLFFTGQVTGSQIPTFTINGGDTVYTIKVPKDGELINLIGHDINDVTKYWQAYTQFELVYNAAAECFIVLNNPVVLSDSDPVTGYTIKADGFSGYEAVGTVKSYAGDTAPYGWLICDGRALSRSTYQSLFSVIGTLYGNGDGTTTFNIPDMRECVPVGSGQNTTASIASHDVYELGQFKDDQLQGHKHNDSGHAHGYGLAPNGSYFRSGGTWTSGNTATGYANLGAPTAVGSYGTPRNGTTTHGKQVGVNYIIKY